MPNLNADSVVLFHDYDPIERGGSSHPGVKVFIDTLIRLDHITRVDHIGRILSCRIKKKNLANAEEFILEWKNMGNSIIDVISKESIIDYIKDFASDNIEISLNELSIRYLFYYATLNNLADLLPITKNRKEYFKWLEPLQMLDDSDLDQYRFEDIFIVKNLVELSSRCSRENVRLSLLKGLVNSFKFYQWGFCFDLCCRR